MIRRRKRDDKAGHGANAATDGRLFTAAAARCEEEGEGQRWLTWMMHP